MSLSKSKESNVVSRSKDDSKDKKYHHLGSKDNVRGQHPSVIEKRVVGVIVNFSCDLCVVSQPNWARTFKVDCILRNIAAVNERFKNKDYSTKYIWI